MIEPLGILDGVDAAASVAAGSARWLAGGPAAFTMVRLEGLVLPLAAVPEFWLADLDRLSAPTAGWAGFGSWPRVMGILNVTPDSFSDGGDLHDPCAAIAAGERMLAGGVDILDVGGESTRPGAQAVPPEIEQARVRPVIRALVRQDAVLSIDTRNASTMAMALDEGVRIVNDVSGLAYDPDALMVAVDRQCPVVLMHMRGTPETMMNLCNYGDVADDVMIELSARAAAVERAGVRRRHIAVDPGIGFAKTALQNIELLRRLPVFLTTGCPIIVGVSRKAIVGMLGREADPRARGPGSVAAALFAISRGARIVRVHDAVETAQAVRVWLGLTGHAV